VEGHRRHLQLKPQGTIKRRSSVSEAMGKFIAENVVSATEVSKYVTKWACI
jgi:hypothetical protein